MTRSAVLCLWLLACGPSAPAAEGPHLLWSEEVSALDNPFPDARFLAGGGTAVLRPGWYKPFLMPKAQTAGVRAFFEGFAAQAGADVVGFGNFGGVLLRASEKVAAASLAGRFARLKRVGEGFEVVERDLAVEPVLDTLAPLGLSPPSDFPDFFLVRPGVPLAPGDEGLLVALDGLTTERGARLERPRAWDSSPQRPALGPIAKALGVSEADILLALPQRPAPVRATFEALAAFVESAAGLPRVEVPAKGTQAQGGAHPVGRWRAEEPDFGQLARWLERFEFARPAAAVGAAVFGTVDLRDLRDPLGAWSPQWVADPSGAPKVPVRFALTVPKGPKPSGGWPTVVGAHGIGGRNSPTEGSTDAFCLNLGQWLAAQGLACLGIDAPSHGARGSFLEFFDVEHLGVIRDRFRQMDFDLLQLARAAAQLDVDADGQGDLGPLRFYGNSLGAIMGAGAAPWVSRFETVVLNVPGAGVGNILASDGIRDTLGLLIAAKTGLRFGTPEYAAAFPVFRAVGQLFLDAGDPVNMEGVHPAGQALLIQMGKGDATIPNFTTLDLKRAMGLAAPEASVTGVVPLRVFAQTDPARYLPPDEARTFNGHNVFDAFPPVREQALRFLSSRGEELFIP